MSTALARVEDGPLPAAARAPVALMRPIGTPAEVLSAQEDTRKLVQQALQEGRDFGKIPGVDKPTLLKPGAERVALAFGCTTRFTIVEQEVDHDREVRWLKTRWVEKPKPDNHAELKTQGIGRNKKYGERWVWQERNDEQGISLGLYRYVVRCELVFRETDQVVGACLGSCSSMESKYIDRPRDCENTIIKMAEKRALVGATLTTFGLSEQFTQDVEDLSRDEPAGSGDEPSPSTGGNTAPPAKCPTCGGAMWDNRTSKTNPKAPDYKCKNKECDGAYWPGQWPPVPTATEKQRAMITELLGKADVDDKMRAKLEKRLAQPLDEKRAGEMIVYLEKLVPKGGVAAAPAPGKVEDALGATKPDLAKLSRTITDLLQNEKFDDAYRAEIRKKVDAADSVASLKFIVEQLEQDIGLPF